MIDVLVGVDVGNSKTHAALTTPEGEVLAVAAGDGASPHSLGVQESWRRIDSLVAHAAARAPAAHRVVAAAYAVAGLDFPEDEEAFTRRNHLISNDIFAVLRAGTDGDGIAVVAGAGMNCVGRRGERTVRFPALGAISGDWGGGIGLGHEALALACRTEDGRGRPTALQRRVPELFGLASAAELARAVSRGTVSPTALAALAPVVLELADAGDDGCRALARRQANEIVALITAAATRLDAAPAEMPIVLAGGLLTAGCRTLDHRLRTTLRKLGATAALAPGPPVVGALLLAADQIHIELDPGALSAQVRDHLARTSRRSGQPTVQNHG